MVRNQDSQSCNTSSILVRSTTKHLLEKVLFCFPLIFFDALLDADDLIAKLCGPVKIQVLDRFVHLLA